MTTRCHFRKTRKCQSKWDAEDFLYVCKSIVVPLHFDCVQWAVGTGLISLAEAGHTEPWGQWPGERARWSERWEGRNLRTHGWFPQRGQPLTALARLGSHHSSLATGTQPANRNEPNTHAFLYYRKGKNKNTKFKQATLSGIMNNTRKLVTLLGFPSHVIVFIFFLSWSGTVVTN